MSNPIKKKRQVESIKGVLESFFGSSAISWSALIVVCLIFIFGSWFTSGFEDVIEYIVGPIAGWQKLIASILILIILILLMIYLIAKIKSRIRVKTKRPDTVKILVIFLSTLGKQEIQEKKLKEIEEKLSINDVSENIVHGCPWEMPFIAIKYHQQTLEKLYVITSNSGSHELMACFKKLVKALYKNIEEVTELTTDGINYESVEDAFDTIDKFYGGSEIINYRKDDIIVDITGGKKISSISGAIASLSLGRKFQYVSTESKEVKSYDIGLTEESKLE